MTKEQLPEVEKVSPMRCPECGEELLIRASHSYSISYDKEQGKYVKDDGTVIYWCDECCEILKVSEIEEALKQVDEL